MIKGSLSICAKQKISILGLFFVSMILSSNSYAIEIKYAINTTSLANLGATVTAGDSHASNTHNGITSESYWGSHHHVDRDNYIAWQFTGGTTTIDAMQIINNEHWNYEHHLLRFSLEYTTELNPTLLDSTYQAVNILDIVGVNAQVVNGNEVSILTPSHDLDIIFDAVSATAVRLHSFPYAGDHVGNGTDGNFLINEVSFNGVAISEPNAINFVLLLTGGLWLFSAANRKSNR